MPPRKTTEVPAPDPKETPPFEAEVRQYSKDFSDVFADAMPEDKPVPIRKYVVRQLRGPKGKNHDPLVITAHDGPDAARQFYNYYSLVGQTTSYQLQCAVLPEDHPRAKDAIKCNAPKDPGHTDWEKRIDEAEAEIERAARTGEFESVFAS